MIATTPQQAAKTQAAAYLYLTDEGNQWEKGQETQASKDAAKRKEAKVKEAGKQHEAANAKGTGNAKRSHPVGDHFARSRPDDCGERDGDCDRTSDEGSCSNFATSLSLPTAVNSLPIPHHIRQGTRHIPCTTRSPDHRAGPSPLPTDIDNTEMLSASSLQRNSRISSTRKAYTALSAAVYTRLPKSDHLRQRTRPRSRRRDCRERSHSRSRDNYRSSHRSDLRSAFFAKDSRMLWRDCWAGLLRSRPPRRGEEVRFQRFIEGIKPPNGKQEILASNDAAKRRNRRSLK